MNSRIIYESAGAVSVMTPCDCGLSVAEIGAKDVPDGVPFWIVGVEDIPTDRTFRGAWELDSGALGDPAGVGDTAKAQEAINRRIAEMEAALLQGQTLLDEALSGTTAEA